MKIKVREGYSFFDKGRAYTHNDGIVEVLTIEGQEWKVATVIAEVPEKKNVPAEDVVDRAIKKGGRKRKADKK